MQKPSAEMARTSRPAHAAIRRTLLAWFRKHARALPWRGTGDPYAVWVSEIMLQQTQIATVIPYYLRFLAAFPTISHLARAPLERVLELWSGLGYYRRARHLHQAAQALAGQFAGKFPEDYDALRTLPGIGDYTAKALLSIAFNQPFAVLDGNVARVVARLFRLRGNLHQPEFRRSVEAELAGLLSRRQPGDFNQALMELGQTVCLPRGPVCPACPLASWCEACQSENPEAFPYRALAARLNPITLLSPFSAREHAWPWSVGLMTACSTTCGISPRPLAVRPKKPWKPLEINFSPSLAHLWRSWTL